MRYVSSLWHWLWPPMSPQIQIWRWLGRVLAVAIATMLAGKFCAQFATLPGNVSAIWLPDAIAVAAALIWGPQIGLGIVIGILYFGLTTFTLTPPHVLLILILAAGDAVTAIVSQQCIQRLTQTRFPFDRPTDILTFLIFGVGLNQVIDAFFGTSLYAVFQIIPWSDFNAVFLTWWLSGSAGIIIVAPPLLTLYFKIYTGWPHPRQTILPRINLETILWLILVVVVSKLAFWHEFSLEYLILVLLIWSAFRFPNSWTNGATIGISLAAVIGTVQMRSVFVKANIDQSLLLLNSFISTIAITTLFLMAILTERARLIGALAQSKQDLEAKVVERTHELLAANAKLQKISVTDPLTQCFNRVKIDELLEQNFQLYQRYKQVFSVILLDLDHFKQVNDQYGHAVGDTLLIEIVRVVDQRLRRTDVLGRWGGEEFIIICAHTTAVNAQQLAAVLRQTLASHYFDSVGHQTASFGVAECTDNHQFPHDVVNQADLALYQAKAEGRDRVVVADMLMNLNQEC